MRFHKVPGGGDIRLNVVESGNTEGRPILYIHGVSQCWLQWSRQLNSDLTQDYRLVAMDMRGHGLSDKPLAGYEGSKMWADDVNAVIETLELDNPILCGWSYGPLVILDYIRHYGEERVGGLHFVGSGGTKLGNEEALAALTPEFLGPGSGVLFERCERECAQSRWPVAPLLLAGARDRGPLSDAGIQRFCPAVCAAGTTVALNQQR